MVISRLKPSLTPYPLKIIKRILATAAVLLFFGIQGLLFAEETRYVHVRHVIDGDTIVVEGGERVRYIGMDAPEIDEPFYAEAKARNSELLKGKNVRLVLCEASLRDKYGRLLAWVYSDGVLVNEALLKEGLARTLTVPPCGLEKAKEFEKVEQEAKGRKIGIWTEGAYARYKNGLKTVPAAEAGKYIGQAVKVAGRVARVYKSRDAVFIDFGKGRERDSFSAVIFKRALKDFDSARINPLNYKGKTITVAGPVKKHGTHPEIIVTRVEQIDLE